MYCRRAYYLSILHKTNMHSNRCSIFTYHIYVNSKVLMCLSPPLFAFYYEKLKEQCTKDDWLLLIWPILEKYSYIIK